MFEDRFMLIEKISINSGKVFPIIRYFDFDQLDEAIKEFERCYAPVILIDQFVKKAVRQRDQD